MFWNIISVDLGFIINKNTEKIHENSNSNIMFGGPVDSESLYVLDFIDDCINKSVLTAPLYNIKDKMIFGRLYWLGFRPA